MKVQALRGFRDYLPAEMLAKTRMLEAVTGVFESFGYPPLQTPALEYSEVLAGKYGEEGEMLMYRFRDHGERDVCMRYDLTVPLARVVAEHADLPMPLRRYQIAPVWRAEKPAKGRYREFVQCDVDLVGADDAMADAEMILVGAGVLRALGVERYTIRINHRGVLRALTRGLGIDDGPREAAFLRLLDKLPKIGEDAFLDGARTEFGLEGDARTRLVELVRAAAETGGAKEALARLANVAGADPAGSAALERLVAMVELIDAGGAGDRIAIDPTIARGLSYYTGAIYETILSDLPGIGSVMSGGRYDGLIGVFSGRELPAVGISLGVDRLFAALRELDPAPLPQTPAEVLVTRFDEAGGGDAMRLAARLRSAGVRCAVYPVSVKLKKQLQYADEIGVPYTAIVGHDEIARGVMTLKDMRSGEQWTLSFDDAAARILGARPEGGVRP